MTTPKKVTWTYDSNPKIQRGWRRLRVGVYPRRGDRRWDGERWETFPAAENVPVLETEIIIRRKERAR